MPGAANRTEEIGKQQMEKDSAVRASSLASIWQISSGIYWRPGQYQGTTGGITCIGPSFWVRYTV